MRKSLAIIGPLTLAAAISGILKADVGIAPVQPLSTLPGGNDYIWWVEQNAAIAKDPEAAGVEAVIDAATLLHDREPQVQIDFFNKALYETKMRPVQREIRMALYQIYKQQGQNDKAMDQLQQLMLDQ
jgi:hypothetical protein